MRSWPPLPFLSSAHASEAGFTLIAMAAVLLVLSAAVVLLLPNEANEARNRLRITQVRMRAIELAVQRYSTYDTAHRLLPCPARYDRSYSATAFQKPVQDCWKAAVPGGCDGTNTYQGLFCNAGSTVVAGSVPVMALNLAPEAMLDGWGNKILYVMDTQLATVTPYSTAYAKPPAYVSPGTASAPGTTSVVLPPAYGSPFQIYSVGSTTPADLRGQPLLNAGVQRPAGLLISAGPNQNGAVSSFGTRGNCMANGYDASNCDFDTDMIRYTADGWHNEDGTFDDIVLPLLLEKRNCQPPVRCAFEPATPVGPMRNEPEGCVTNSYLSSTAAFPVAFGGLRHGDKRNKGTSGTYLMCCDGEWKDNVASCP